MQLLNILLLLCFTAASNSSPIIFSDENSQSLMNKSESFENEHLPRYSSQNEELLLHLKALSSEDSVSSPRLYLSSIQVRNRVTRKRRDLDSSSKSSEQIGHAQTAHRQLNPITSKPTATKTAKKLDDDRSSDIYTNTDSSHSRISKRIHPQDLNRKGTSLASMSSKTIPAIQYSTRVSSLASTSSKAIYPQDSTRSLSSTSGSSKTIDAIQDSNRGLASISTAKQAKPHHSTRTAKKTLSPLSYQVVDNHRRHTKSSSSH